MGADASKTVYNPDGSMTEVYILFKKLGNDCYTQDPDVSHHICLLKSAGNFYYTELQSSGDGSKGKGPIKIQFGEYHFLKSRPIYYYRIGCTRKTISQIEDFANQSCFNGSSYNFLFHNCQDFVEACIKFLKIETPVTEPGKFAGRQTSGEKMFDAISTSDPRNISLN